jgi:hypothetical protein
MSRRVIPSCGSQRSFPACPGTMIIGSLLVRGLVDLWERIIACGRNALDEIENEYAWILKH